MSRPLTVLLAVTGVLMTLLAAPAQAASDRDVIGANTTGVDGVLSKGCHQYRYAYAVQVPTEDWTLEVSIVDRQGHAVASFAYLGPMDPKTQTSTFTLCRGSTVPGNFRIKGILNWYDDPSVPNQAYVPVTRFRLARR